jgi:hypothetical protein
MTYEVQKTLQAIDELQWRLDTFDADLSSTVKQISMLEHVR